MAGEIVNPGMLDSPSVIGATTYPPLAIGGVLKVLDKPTPEGGIYTTNGIGKTLPDGSPNPNILPIMIMDTEKSAGTYPPVPGVAPPPTPPTPATITRTGISPVMNPPQTGVYFRGNLVSVAGDGMIAAPPTTPPIRTIIENVLTSPTLYPTIIIGTKTI